MNERTCYFAGIGEVRLIRKPNLKRLRISMKTSGEVVVSIPWLFPFSRGEAFLEEKKEWVIKTRQKLERLGVTRKPLQPGALFSTRNFNYLLLPANSVRLQVKVVAETKEVQIRYPENISLQEAELQAKIKRAMEGVLRYEAKRYLPGRLKQLAGLLGYSYKALTIKNNKTNWGSCSSLKNINLNLHLMRLPDRLIDYIIVHELVHTKIPNHGPEFKRRLKGHFPDGDHLEKEIKKFRPEIL